MDFWAYPSVATLIALLVLLALADGIGRALPALRKLAVPASILAGIAGLLLGPQVLGVAPLDTEVMETLVYHGLGVVFVAVGLSPPREGGGRGVRPMAFMITWMLAIQALVGLAIVAVLSATGPDLHPGLGLLVPLGFEQGPGQALSIGRGWEALGFVDGGQIGLIIAAAGFAWSVLIGVPLVAWGRRRGLLSPTRTGDTQTAGAPAGAGTLDPLSRTAARVAVVYAATWLLCKGLAAAFAGAPDIAHMVWGFHFLLGALIAMAVRGPLDRLAGPADPRSLGHIAGSTVDVITCAALAAVQIAVLQANWLPILLLTTAGGLVTLVSAVWLSKRAFPEAPFEHAVVVFGTATGTLPTGLALLRMIDPELRSPAPVSAVIGSAPAILGGAPLVLGLMPWAVREWPDAHPLRTWIATGIALAWVVAILVVWARWGGLRLSAPHREMWPGA